MSVVWSQEARHSRVSLAVFSDWREGFGRSATRTRQAVGKVSGLGPRNPEVHHPNVRELIEGDYRILYERLHNQVLIFAVVDGRIPFRSE